MSPKYLKSHLPYLAVITALTVMIGTNVFANRNLAGNQGVPAELLQELYTLQEQVAQVTDDVGDLSQLYMDSTATIGDLTGSICFTVALDVGATAGLGASGVLKASAATGIDIYGLINIEAGGEINGNVNVAADLGAKGELSTVLCINAGVLKLQADGTLSSPFGDLNLVDTGQEGLAATMNAFNQVGPAARDGIIQLAQLAEASYQAVPGTVDLVVDTVSSTGGSLVASALDTSTYADIMGKLPGGQYMLDRVESVFDSLGDGNVCELLSGAGITDVIDARIFGFLSSVCSAVPGAFKTGVNTIGGFVNQMIALMANVTKAADFAEMAWHAVVSGVQPVIDAINSAVSSVRSMANKICSAVPGC